jgi:hypothetical protein
MPNIQSNSEGKKSIAKGITISNFKLHYKTIITKTHDTSTKADMKTNGLG